ncbi:dihydrofolate reductase family protein [Pedobacter antarcticus]|uniref:dihydrofolate reductase family protein n=1 Tax=Pedobacter antarcticus TaxID=34086 RepID=UPI0029315D15|nr:dihydrofolate reductase family protein [Pedobacter antarcticus]
MRKLKLQMQISADGYAAGPAGELDWLVWGWDETLKAHVSKQTENVDCILLGRKLADGFIPHWQSLQDNPDTADAFSDKMVNTPKIVFSASTNPGDWKNTMVISSDAETFIRQLKSQPGKDIIVYGGCSFVSSLIDSGLIDEFHLYMNPVAISKGLSVFRKSSENIQLRLTQSISFSSGIVLLQYEPK